MTDTTTVAVTIKPETSSAKKRIIKINECPTLTNKSTLTYHIGCDDNKNIYFPADANSGNASHEKELAILPLFSTGRFGSLAALLHLTQTSKMHVEERGFKPPSFGLSQIQFIARSTYIMLTYKKALTPKRR